VLTACFREYFEASMNDPIYVILGVQGSGTNLLARLLTRLFGFSIMRDRASVFNAAGRLGPAPSPRDVEREIARFRKLVRPSRLRRMTSKYAIRNREPLEGIFSELVPSAVNSGADFARLIYAYRAYSLGASHAGIKSDDLWENIHLIDHVIPNRRVILLTRDFRDNLVSISGKRFGPIEPLRAAHYVKNQIGIYAREFRRAGESGHHITFEALLNDTRQFAEDLARHFSLKPIVDLDSAIPALQFRPNKIGKWKALSQRELSLCEGVLHAELIEFGYQPTTPAPVLPSAVDMAVATARDTFKRLPQKLRRLGERAKTEA